MKALPMKMLAMKKFLSKIFWMKKLPKKMPLSKSPQKKMPLSKSLPKKTLSRRCEVAFRVGNSGRNLLQNLYKIFEYKNKENLFSNAKARIYNVKSLQYDQPL